MLMISVMNGLVWVMLELHKWLLHNHKRLHRQLLQLRHLQLRHLPHLLRHKRLLPLLHSHQLLQVLQLFLNLPHRLPHHLLRNLKLLHLLLRERAGAGCMDSVSSTAATLSHVLSERIAGVSEIK